MYYEVELQNAEDFCDRVERQCQHEADRASRLAAHKAAWRAGATEREKNRASKIGSPQSTAQTIETRQKTTEPQKPI